VLARLGLLLLLALRVGSNSTKQRKHCILPTKVLWSGVEFSALGEPQPKPVNHYLPLDLWSSNVGSQVGLDEALGKLNNFYETHGTTPHSFGVVDINIFYQYYQVPSKPHPP